MEPTIGRIVHYKRNDKDTSPYPAIIVFVDGQRLLLTVFIPNGDLHIETTEQAENFESAAGNQWMWPPRV